jgi:transposase-like protein
VVCRCGCTDFEKRGFHYTSAGKFQRYRCNECGAWTRDKVNLLSKDKVKSLRCTTNS